MQMSKRRKPSAAGSQKPFAGAPEKPFSAQPDFSEIESRSTSDDGSFNDGQKETSGIWFLAILVALLFLVLLQHWLRQ
jgi:hypothetical protein